MTMVYTVTDSLGNLKGGATVSTGSNDWAGEWCGELTGDCDMVPGDLVTVTTDTGFFAVLEPIPISGRIDLENNQMVGEMEGAAYPSFGEYLISRYSGGESYGDRFSIEDDGTFIINLDGLFSAQTGDASEIWYIDPNGNYVGTEFRTANIYLNYAHDWVEVRSNQTADVMIELDGKATIQGITEIDGWFRSHKHNPDWNPPGQPDIMEGDVVTVTADGYAAAVNPIGSIIGTADPVENLVEGTLNAPFETPLKVYCEIWTENAPSIEVADVDPDGGTFSCDFDDVGWDLRPGPDIGLVYVEPDGDHIMNAIKLPYARANTTWNAVDGWFGEDVQVDFEVADSLGILKGGGSGMTKSDGWMDGVNCGCDMLPGDYVTVTSDTGFYAVLRPVPITAQIDEALDRVTGLVSSGVFPADGSAEAWNHGRQEGTSISMDILGSGAFTADFSSRFRYLVGRLDQHLVSRPERQPAGRRVCWAAN